MCLHSSNSSEAWNAIVMHRHGAAAAMRSLEHTFLYGFFQRIHSLLTLQMLEGSQSVAHGHAYSVPLGCSPGSVIQRSCVLTLEHRTRESNEQSYYMPVHDIPGLIMRMRVARSPPAPGQAWSGGPRLWDILFGNLLPSPQCHLSHRCVHPVGSSVPLQLVVDCSLYEVWKMDYY